MGSGAWGTAIAKCIAENGHDVVIWCRRKEQADEINTKHTNTKYLPGVILPDNICAGTGIKESIDGKDFLILAIPSFFLIDAVKKIIDLPSIRAGTTIIGIITKGFLPSEDGASTIIDTLQKILPEVYYKSLVYISGPSHAEEVCMGKITGLISACRKPSLAVRMKYLLKSRSLLVFSSLDVQGVQVSAAVKNIAAIGFGIMDALKSKTEIFGDNTESLLLAAGLNEIQILGRSLGSTHFETFTSIAGVGDLDVTCRSVYGRNRRLGREIITKNILSGFKDIADLIARINEIPYTPEGVAAAFHVKTLQQKFNLRLPLCNLVYCVLNKEKEPIIALNDYLRSLS
jgi:glycerol-3-phosphate dehydrogenase (NAD(P)+)